MFGLSLIFPVWYVWTIIDFLSGSGELKPRCFQLISPLQHLIAVGSDMS
jgi:hypothetical protein